MLYDEYERLFEENVQDRNCTVLLMQVGKFYEVYAADPESLGRLERVANLLTLQKSCPKGVGRGPIGRSNPVNIGFPDKILDKHLPVLVSNGWRVIIARQGEDNLRSVTEVVTLGTLQASAYGEDRGDSTYMSVICLCDLSTNAQRCIDMGIVVIDVMLAKPWVAQLRVRDVREHAATADICSILSERPPCELHIVSPTFDASELETLTSKLVASLPGSPFVQYDGAQSFDRSLTHKERLSQLMSMAYTSDVAKMATPLELAGLVSPSLAVTTAFASMLDNLAMCNPTLLRRMQAPGIIEPRHSAFLSTKATEHLDIPILERLLNRCKTPMGRRLFSERLRHPYRSVQDIEQELDNVARFVEAPSTVERARNDLDKVCDLERVMRKMLIGSGTLDMLRSMRNSLVVALQFFNNMKDAMMPSGLADAVHGLQAVLTVDGDIADGVDAELDAALARKNMTTDVEGDIRSYASAFVGDVKFKFERDQIVVSKTRYETFKRLMCAPPCVLPYGTIDFSKHHVERTRDGTWKVYIHDVASLMASRARSNAEADAVMASVIKRVAAEYASRFTDVIRSCSVAIARIDVSSTSALNAVEYRYVCPRVVVCNERASMDVTGLRHPIVERKQTDTVYVTNDIVLGKEPMGILLYGENASGKSTLMKAIGLAILVAQCGMFVPAASMVFSPYDHIFTRLSHHDDLLRGQSTFMTEMIEFNMALQRSSARSIVLGDELCSSTEFPSAIGIVTAGIQELLEVKGSQFVFTTHMHELQFIDEVVAMHASSKLRIAHLETRYDSATRTNFYYRKLQDGAGNATYGIECCAHIGMPSSLVKRASTVRAKFLRVAPQGKKSRYNAKKLLSSSCEVCGRVGPVDVHHIRHQSSASKDGGILPDGVTHKDHKANLVCLCHVCHEKVHTGALEVHGYMMTSRGIQLVHHASDE